MNKHEVVLKIAEVFDEWSGDADIAVSIKDMLEVGQQIYPLVERLVAQATEAERERCAGIAREIALYYENKADRVPSNAPSMARIVLLEKANAAIKIAKRIINSAAIRASSGDQEASER